MNENFEYVVELNRELLERELIASGWALHKPGVLAAISHEESQLKTFNLKTLEYTANGLTMTFRPDSSVFDLVKWVKPARAITGGRVLGYVDNWRRCLLCIRESDNRLVYYFEGYASRSRDRGINITQSKLVFDEETLADDFRMNCLKLLKELRIDYLPTEDLIGVAKFLIGHEVIGIEEDGWVYFVDGDEVACTFHEFLISEYSSYKNLPPEFDHWTHYGNSQLVKDYFKSTTGIPIGTIAFTNYSVDFSVQDDGKLWYQTTSASKLELFEAGNFTTESTLKVIGMMAKIIHDSSK